jgi:hypothetical protein
MHVVAELSAVLATIAHSSQSVCHDLAGDMTSGEHMVDWIPLVQRLEAELSHVWDTSSLLFALASEAGATVQQRAALELIGVLLSSMGHET